MCGIAGIIGDVGPPDIAIVERMNGLQIHRGPDDSKVVSLSGAVLGHTRLTIIDLSDRAMQPLFSTDGRHVIVFNGEIYNYRELRAELAAEYRFTSQSDTEVLLAAFQRWGEGCLEHLVGMFAFCIFDIAARSVFLARDRFGQKPLHFCKVEGRLVFASEIKALFAAGAPRRPDRKVWARYLLDAAYEDDDATFFEGIKQLLPGECAWLRPGRELERRIYYAVGDYVRPSGIGFADGAREIRETLTDIARIHMRSDVPVGVSLSGGFDSAALLASIELAGKLHEGVGCFSVEYEGGNSEADWIRGTARHHGLKDQIEYLSPNRLLGILDSMVWHLDGPVAGVGTFGQVVVMEMARRHGFKVMQDGCGMDEAFGGYRNFHNLYVAQRVLDGDPSAAQVLRDYARNWDVDEATARKAVLAEPSTLNSAVDGTSPSRPDLVDRDLNADYDGGNGVSSRPTTGDLMRDIQLSYVHYFKIPRSTRDKDRASMAFGIELRQPFLDHRLMELALRMPTHYYFAQGRSKSIVREALAGCMNEDVRVAAKRSVSNPQGAWLRTSPMKEYINEVINSGSFANLGLFDVKKVKHAFKEFCRGGMNNSFFVWQWINAEAWCRQFIDDDPAKNTSPVCPEIYGHAGAAAKSIRCN